MEYSFVKQSWATLKTKDQVLACYQSFIDTLSQAIRDIQNISAKNRKFERIQEKSLYDISKLLNESRTQMEQVMKETIWDKLVIAFFGETNAGKSTIIETFRVMFNDEARLSAIRANGGKGVDGLIVGDGRQDFTQIYEKYNLEIDGRPFVLIDVPGIEGKEANYLEEISSALKQAHCIFYVQGHNKKPDAATADKIKGFLSDWVDVYSIYNVRGGVRDYDEVQERLSLITPKVVEIQESIKSVFNEVLGTVYKGNVTIQGYLALLSVADFHESREKLIEDQAKIEQFFGNRQTMELFSGFGSITDLVREQSSDFSAHILDANVQKLRSLSNRIYKGVSDTIMSQKIGLEKLVNQLMQFKRDMGTIRDTEVAKLKGKIDSEQSQAFFALQAAGNDIIDSGRSIDEWSDRLSSRFSQIVYSFEESLNKIYSESVSSFHLRVDEKRKDLDRVLFGKISLPDPDIRFDLNLSKVLNALCFSIKEDLIKGGLNAFFNPIGTIIKLFKKSNDGRDKAKQLISKELERMGASIRDRIDLETAQVQEYLKKEERTIRNAVNYEIDNIDTLNKDLEKLKMVFNCN